MSNLDYRPVPSISFIDLIGPGVPQFLAGQLTINADLIGPKTAKLAAFCNHKGRINSLFHIVAIKQGFRLIMPKCVVNASLAHIKKYSVFFKLSVSINENQTVSAAVLATTSATLKQSSPPEQTIPEQTINIASTDLSVKIGEPPIEQSLPQAGDDFWYWHLAEKNIPWLTKESVEHFLPHHLNLPALNAVDFGKGCFTGQEIIARMQYKGALKQHLQELYSPKVMKIGAMSPLFQCDKKVAEIVCGAIHPEYGYLALAIVKDSADKDKNFQLKLENASILGLRVRK